MTIDINQYLGTWFEIARIHNNFERDMTGVTAEYKLLDNGDILIINSGYINEKLKQIKGIAKTTDKDDLLKVSFFYKIYSDYKILAIDENYQYSLVGGSKSNFLWILSRKPSIPKNIYDWFVSIAEKKGYNISKLEITK